MCVAFPHDSSGNAEGGWRVVTSMRSVADLLASRSCNEAHWHRPVEGMFPPAATLPHLCRRLMPTVLRRPTPMELAELVVGATIKRRLRSKQSIQRRLTRKQPPPGKSAPVIKSGNRDSPRSGRASSCARQDRTEASTDRDRKDCVVGTFSWRARSVRRLWSTCCIENSGIHQEHGGQSATKSCSSNSAGGRQTDEVQRLARRAPDCYLVRCPVGRSWSLERSYRWTVLLEALHEGGACQRHAVGGCPFESSRGPDLADCTPSGTSWKKDAFENVCFGNGWRRRMRNGIRNQLRQRGALESWTKCLMC